MAVILLILKRFSNYLDCQHRFKAAVFVCMYATVTLAAITTGQGKPRYRASYSVDSSEAFLV